MMNTDNIPPRILAGLNRYWNEHVATGHFLRGALENDLREAVLRADANSLAALRDIVLFIYNELPSECHGSKEKVAAWIKIGDERAHNRMEQQRKEAEQSERKTP